MSLVKRKEILIGPFDFRCLRAIAPLFSGEMVRRRGMKRK
jgi:hypothetical protein